MSSDNYILIDKHPYGGFAVEDRFLSGDDRPVSPKSLRYETFDDALGEAQRRMKSMTYEYGIVISDLTKNK